MARLPQLQNTESLREAFRAGKVAHLAVDLQRFYTDPAFAPYNAIPACKRVKFLTGHVDDFADRLRPWARNAWIYTVMLPDFKEFEHLAGRVKPAEDIVVGKSEYSGFVNTLLCEKLDKDGISTVLLSGAFKDFCVLQTALDAKSAGFEPVIVEDLSVWSLRANMSSIAMKCARNQWKTFTQQQMEKHGVRAIRSRDVLSLLPGSAP